MLHIAGGILIALLFLVCIPLFIYLIGPIAVAAIYVISAPFMFYGWIKRKLKGE